MMAGDPEASATKLGFKLGQLLPHHQQHEGMIDVLLCLSRAAEEARGPEPTQEAWMLLGEINERLAN